MITCIHFLQVLPCRQGCCTIPAHFMKTTPYLFNVIAGKRSTHCLCKVFQNFLPTKSYAQGRTGLLSSNSKIGWSFFLHLAVNVIAQWDLNSPTDTINDASNACVYPDLPFLCRWSSCLHPVSPWEPPLSGGTADRHTTWSPAAHHLKTHLRDRQPNRTASRQYLATNRYLWCPSVK